MRESDVVAEQGGGSRVRRRQRTPAVWPLCNARPVDWLFVAFVGLLAVALAVAIAFGLDRERALDAAERRRVGAIAFEQDVREVVRRLRAEDLAVDDGDAAVVVGPRRAASDEHRVIAFVEQGFQTVH